VDLSRRQPLDLPAARGAAELDLRWQGEAVGRAQPVDPARQWDWDLATQRVVDAAADPLRRSAPELLRF
jgi:hypothetical protein